MTEARSKEDKNNYRRNELRMKKLFNYFIYVVFFFVLVYPWFIVAARNILTEEKNLKIM